MKAAILTISICFFLATAVAGKTRLQQHLCETALNSGNSEAIALACTSETNIAWYQDRDNSMSDANDEVGQNMVVIMSKNNKTIATQVYCPANPGTVLGAAHGIVDNPATAVEQGREYRTPADNLWGVAAFPFSAKNYSEVSNDSQVVSPGTDLNADWAVRSEDYAFIIPDRRLNTELDGIKILNASSSELVTASENNELDVYLYRARTIYHENPDGAPDFTRPPPRNPDLDPIYDIPQRVNQSCRMQEAQSSSLTLTDCPFEQGVSGSPLISEIDGVPYLSGIVHGGLDSNFESFGPMSAGSAFLNSSEFCSDYENVCGVPCSNVDEVLR